MPSTRKSLETVFNKVLEDARDFGIEAERTRCILLVGDWLNSLEGPGIQYSATALMVELRDGRLDFVDPES